MQSGAYCEPEVSVVCGATAESGVCNVTEVSGSTGLCTRRCAALLPGRVCRSVITCVCVCVCVCVCYSCMHVSVAMSCLPVCMYACMCACMYVCVYVCMHACMPSLSSITLLSAHQDTRAHTGTPSVRGAFTTDTARHQWRLDGRHGTT